MLSLSVRPIVVVLAAMTSLAVVMVLGAPADPASAGTDAGTTAMLAQEDGPVVRGTLQVPGEDGGPVAGVDIVVTTADGSEIGTATTADDGTWTIAVPGPGDYTAELDVDTLPEGVEVRDADRNPLEFDIRQGQSRTLIFALGEGGGGGAQLLDRFLAATANGLKFGLIIGMAAIGLSLIFGTTGLVNFAHGELVTFGAVFAWFLNTPNAWGGGVQLLIAAAIAIAATAAVGGGLELGLWRPLRRRRTGLIQMLVISIGLSLLARNLIQIWFGGRSQPYFDYTIQEQLDLGPFAYTPRDLAIIAISIASLVGVGLMLQRTRIGKAMRAVADNKDLAESSGIDVQRVILVVWVLGAGLAATGGILNGVDQNVSFLLGFRLLLLIFAGVILGGLGTAYGAMVGSLVVGLVTEWSVVWFSPELKFVWALFVLIVILLFRPQGILGQRERIG